MEIEDIVKSKNIIVKNPDALKKFMQKGTRKCATSKSWYLDYQRSRLSRQIPGRKWSNHPLVCYQEAGSRCS